MATDLSTDARSTFERDGFRVAHGLFAPEEVARLRAHLHALNGTPGFSEEGLFDPSSEDPLRRWPRLMQPHLRDEAAWRFVSDGRIGARLTELLGGAPLIAQTMVYFKPPGGRGQALHQDNRFLQVSPGTCVAAWLALDPTDAHNGCLQVVPGSHHLDLLCPVPGDLGRSFSAETVPVPPGMGVVDVPMQAGDVLFFHGHLIHGSEPNRTADRFRTIIVGHYAAGRPEVISDAYPEAMTFDGDVVRLQHAAAGGPCGTFVDGRFELTSTVDAAAGAH